MAKAKTKPATTSAIHALVGSDDAAVKREAAELAQKLAPAEAGEFGLDTIDGAADNVDGAATAIRSTIAALQTLPFFGGGKLVWLKSANFLSDDVKGKSASVLEPLEELGDLLTSGLADGVTFLLSAVDPDKRRSFYKTLSKIAEVEVFEEPDLNRSGWEENAGEIVRAEAKKRGLRFDEEALELFVLSTGGDARAVANELEKLSLYAPESTITLEQVRELVPVSRAGVIFELGNALARRDVTTALNLVRTLLDQGESAIGILLATLLPTIRNLLLAKDLMERHRLSRPTAPFNFISSLNRLPAEATEHLPRKKDGGINGYVLGLAAMNAHRFETAKLVDALEACLRANVQLVTSQLDPQLVLTEIVVKMLV
ncbi:MAG: DNA polymerase III subunit delta [Verrucomicrobiota bacterium]|nr:DNA polymerase III subunit delta [Verrucomicrobiota bacterium]